MYLVSAALDSQSEKKVMAALQHSMEYTKSMVMVTHRLGVIRALNVNRVVVLEQGKIVESGHPEELLLNDDSLYAALAKEQGITATSAFLRMPSQNTSATVL
jgi:ABC-type multidrug transport system fused ATPase/permease subunit